MEALAEVPASRLGAPAYEFMRACEASALVTAINSTIAIIRPIGWASS